MGLEMSLSLELSLTVGAGEWTFPSVSSKMCLEGILVLEALRAVLTLVLLTPSYFPTLTHLCLRNLGIFCLLEFWRFVSAKAEARRCMLVAARLTDLPGRVN